MLGRRLLTTVALLALTSACASSGPAVQLPELVGGLSVGSGVQVRLSPDGVAGGMEGAQLLQPMHHDRKALRAQLAQLHKEQAAAASKSFSVDPDTVYVWLDVRVPFGIVRNVLTDLGKVGFKRIHVVGRNGAGTLSATRLHVTRPKDTEGPDLSLVWGDETEKATKRRETLAQSLPKKKKRVTGRALDAVIAKNAGLLAAIGHTPIEGVEVGTWEGNSYRAYKKEHCPAITYGPEGRLDAKRLPAFAASTCGRSGNAMAIGLGPGDETLWGDVAALARQATAPDCKVALFLESASRSPVGCGSSLTSIFGSANDATLSNKIGGLIGAKGVQIGSGGLGMRGSGLGGGGRGGGGTAGGLGRIGGLGTKGKGGGGFGRGFGSRNAARVIAGVPSVTGFCDKAIVQRVVRRHLNQLRYCYQKELIKKPALAGKVAIHWVIDKNGAVSKALLKANIAGGEAVGTCVQRRFMRMRFPKPNQGICVVRAPFVFKPGAPAKTKKPAPKKAKP